MQRLSTVLPNVRGAPFPLAGPGAPREMPSVKSGVRSFVLKMCTGTGTKDCATTASPISPFQGSDSLPALPRAALADSLCPGLSNPSPLGWRRRRIPKAKGQRLIYA